MGLNRTRPENTAGPLGTARATSRIPLARPYMTEEVKREVCRVLDSGYLTEGPVAGELETAAKDFIGCQHAIAVTSCTVGLEMALRALGIVPGDEVIVPDFTYPATADAVMLVGATAVLVDISPETMLIDYDAAEAAVTDRTKAILPVSQFGNPLDYDQLNAIKKEHGLFVVEDAAPAFGAAYRDTQVGNLADITAFSFHPRKILTTGEGGLVTTNNVDWASRINSYKHFGIDASAVGSAACFKGIGTNYKLSDILAAVGLVQMRHIEELLERRAEFAGRYTELLSGDSRVKLPAATPEGKRVWQSFCVFVENRDEIMRRMRAENIEVQIGTYALHRQPAFSAGERVRIAGELAGSSYAFEHCLALPLYHELTVEDQKTVVNMLKGYL